MQLPTALSYFHLPAVQLQAFLARKAQESFGLVIKLPQQLPEDAEAHFVRLLQTMVRVSYS